MIIKQTTCCVRESRHDNSKPIIIASLATTTLSKQFRHDNNRQMTLYSGHTFHSHDHQTDLLKESRHDNRRQITIASLATTILSEQHYRV